MRRPPPGLRPVRYAYAPPSVEKLLGCLPVVAELCRRLDLAGIVDRACPMRAEVARVTHGQVIEALVANRLSSHGRCCGSRTGQVSGRSRSDGRHVVLTYPSKQALAAVMAKFKQATGRGTTSLRLAEVLRMVNPILKGWAAYFRYGVSKKTFAYLGYYAWWRMLGWIRHKHPHLTWKQLRRRYFGTDRISEDGLVLYNPAKTRVERYRGAQISTPYNVDQVDPAGARFRRTTHDDVAFVGQVSQLVSS